MSGIFLALGSNVGNRKKNIEEAILRIGKEVSVIKVASIYETSPVGFKDQNNFLNTVVQVKTDKDPVGLLLYIKEIEEQIGRIKRFRNGPREIDIDLILFEDIVLNSDSLNLPHPRLHLRDFVLLPLNEISSKIVHPVLGKSIKELVEEVNEGDKSVLRVLID